MAPGKGSDRTSKLHGRLGSLDVAYLLLEAYWQIESERGKVRLMVKGFGELLMLPWVLGGV